MLRNPTFVLIAALALLPAGCTSEQVTVEPPVSSPAEPPEVTLPECVVDRGAGAPTPATGQDFTTITAGLFTVGSDTSYPPFADIRDAEAVGFDVDLINEVADRLGGLEVEVVGGPPGTILQALAADELDVVISAVTIEQERARSVDFSAPYFSADLALTIRTTDAGTINGVEDLDGRVVGVQEGRTAEACARNALVTRYGAAEVRTHETVIGAFEDLEAERVDAVLSALPVSEHLVGERVGSAVAQVIRTQEEFGIAVSKRNPNLREAIDRAVSAIRADGTSETLFDRWFQAGPPGG